MQEMETWLEKQDRLIQELDPKLRDKISDFRKQLHAAPFTVADIPEGLRQQYEGKMGSVSIVYVYPNMSILDGQAAKRFIQEIRNLKLPDGVVPAGEPVVYVDILTLLERDTPRAMLISFGDVILLLLIHFRRPGHVLWVLAPVLFGFLWLAGLADIVGFKFNYMNVAILPSILGVGIDNGIYIFDRYKREGKSTLVDIMQKTGKAVLLASLTTMAAFASLLCARHRGMASLGELGFLGFASCLATSVIFIPALIEFFELKYWRPFQETHLL